jgi:hypothetical protein
VPLKPSQALHKLIFSEFNGHQMEKLARQQSYPLPSDLSLTPYALQKELKTLFN